MLAKYLKQYKLSNRGTKADKIRRISLHVLGEIEGKQKDGEPDDESLDESDEATEILEDDSSSEHDQDIVLAELAGDSANNSESEQESMCTSRPLQHNIDTNDKLWSVFQSDSENEEFYGF